MVVFLDRTGSELCCVTVVSLSFTRDIAGYVDTLPLFCVFVLDQNYHLSFLESHHFCNAGFFI